MAAVDDPFETEAKRVLERLIGGSIVDRDVPPVQGSRDFDLVDDAGDVTDAVEVTSVQLPAVRGTRSAIERLRQLDLGLRQSWSLTVHETVAVAPIRETAPALLNQLSDLGVDRFDGMPESAEPLVRRVVRQLIALGVQHGRAIPQISPARLIASAYGSGSLDTSNLTIAVEAELDKVDNRRKLAAAPAGAKRHLFVWLDHSNWYVSSLMMLGGLPLPPAPQLPAEVDVAWIAIAEGAPPVCVAILRADAAGVEALDPATGIQLPTPTIGADGPPSPPPDCPGCGQPSAWTIVQRSRRPLGGRVVELVDGWVAECAADPTHFALPGRALSRRERHDQGRP